MQVAKIWSLQLNKQKNGATIRFPEGLEDTPFTIHFNNSIRWIRHFFNLIANIFENGSTQSPSKSKIQTFGSVISMGLMLVHFQEY